MTGQTIRQYRKASGITQKQLAEILSEQTGSKFDEPSVSRMERGIYVIPENVSGYIESKIASNGLASSVDARKTGGRATLPPAQKKSLKQAISKNWYDRGLTQCERVIAYIEEFGSITTKEAFDMIGVARLASRIFDLEQMGYAFDRKAEVLPNRYGDKVRFVRYSLRKDDGKEDLDRQ